VSRQVTNSTQKANIHRRSQWITRYIDKQKQKLSVNNLQLFLNYNDDMIIHSLSENTRYKNLNHFGILTKFLDGNWMDASENDLRMLVSKIMLKHGENGKETGYTFVLKMSLRAIVRFVHLGLRTKPEDGELQLIRFIKSKKPKDKLTREDLPTDKEVQSILAVCADSTRDKAMFSVHADAGTRVGELLAMQIKDFSLDQHGGMIKVDGKTGVRPIRIVKSVPYLTRWLNDHPFKDNPESPLWIYIHAQDTFGNPINYAGFNTILQKRVRQARITKRISSHLFRHKEITDLAGKLTESESRMRHGWERTSLMPSKYTHLNQDDLDDKMLQVMGVKKQEIEKEPIRECAFCKIQYPQEIRFCDNCSRPLDVADAIIMEKESEERQRALVLEIMRQERSKKSKNNENVEKEKTIQDQQKEIDELKKIVTKLSSG
jgi:integrase/recombinase XerD